MTVMKEPVKKGCGENFITGEHPDDPWPERGSHQL
jgi:hypothetical protein